MDKSIMVIVCCKYSFIKKKLSKKYDNDFSKVSKDNEYYFFA